VLVFEIPETGKDLELDLIPRGGGDTFRFLIAGKRIKKQITGGFVAFKTEAPKAPAARGLPPTGGFVGNTGGALPDDKAQKIRDEYQRRTSRIQEKFESQRKAAKTAKAKREAEKSRDQSLDFLVTDLCRTYGISEADLDRIVSTK
jgi:hypothetical protein